MLLWTFSSRWQNWSTGMLSFSLCNKWMEQETDKQQQPQQTHNKRRGITLLSGPSLFFCFFFSPTPWTKTLKMIIYGPLCIPPSASSITLVLKDLCPALTSFLSFWPTVRLPVIRFYLDVPLTPWLSVPKMYLTQIIASSRNYHRSPNPPGVQSRASSLERWISQPSSHLEIFLQSFPTHPSSFLSWPPSKPY